MFPSYDTLAADYDAHRRAHAGVARALLGGGRLSPESDVLEVGCGTANYLNVLWNRCGCRCVGIDPSDAMLSVGRAVNPELALLPGQAASLPGPPNAFDLVYSVDVIHHLEDTAAYFGEAWRVLKSGGRLCTVTDSESIIRSRRPLADYFPETVTADLARFPAIADLRQQLADAGFVAIEEAEVEHRYAVTDAGPYESKAFSCLQLLAEEAFERGLRRLTDDLQRGPVEGCSRYVLLWAVKP